MRDVLAEAFDSDRSPKTPVYKRHNPSTPTTGSSMHTPRSEQRSRTEFKSPGSPANVLDYGDAAPGNKKACLLSAAVDDINPEEIDLDAF